MRGTVLYSSQNVRFEESPDPTIIEPTDAIKEKLNVLLYSESVRLVSEGPAVPSSF